MKKSIMMVMALVICVALIASPAFAKTKFQLGIKAGLGLANAAEKDTAGNSPVDPYKPKMKMGLDAGVFFRIIPSEQICIQPEILYTMKGYKLNDFTTEGDTVTNYKWNANFIEIPVLVKYLIPTQGNFKPNIFVGPYLGILASLKEKATVNGTDSTVDRKDSTVKKIDFGAVFGVGFDYKVGTSGVLTFDARYELGLTNLEKNPIGSSKSKASNIAFMIGYAFDMGKHEATEPKK